MTPTTFTITRSNWYRGHGSGCSALLVLPEDGGGMCCLGHVMKQCGYLDSEIQAKGSPWSLEDKSRVPDAFLRPSGYNSDMTVEMIKANDSPTLTDAERETALIALAAPHGITLIFVD